MRRPPAVKPANLIHWWPLYQGAATDIIGGSNGTLVNTPVAAQGRIDEGLDFESSSSQHVTMGDLDVINNTDITVAAWVKIESTGTAKTIWSEANSADDDPIFELLVGGGSSIFFTHRDDAATLVFVESTTTLSTSTWYFVAGTKEGNTRKVFVNAVEEATDTTTLGTTTVDKSAIGGLAQGTIVEFMDGVIQDVMVWDAALSAAELKAQMSIGTYGVMYS